MTSSPNSINPTSLVSTTRSANGWLRDRGGRWPNLRTRTRGTGRADGAIAAITIINGWCRRRRAVTPLEEVEAQQLKAGLGVQAEIKPCRLAPVAQSPCPVLVETSVQGQAQTENDPFARFSSNVLLNTEWPWRRCDMVLSARRYSCHAGSSSCSVVIKFLFGC